MTGRAAEYFSTNFGLPPITARVLGWLMISQPAEQSGAQIATAVVASRASITSTLRLLLATGLVSRRARRGDRTVYYAVGDRAWEQVVRRRITSMAEFTEIADVAVEKLEAAGQSADRIRTARAVFQWFTQLAEAPELGSTPQEKL